MYRLSLRRCPGNYAVQRAGAGSQGTIRAGVGIFSDLPGMGQAVSGCSAFLEMLIANGAPLYLLAVFRGMDGKRPVPILFPSGRKAAGQLLRGILWAGTGFLAAYALLWFAAGLSGTLFFRDMQTGMPAWKMLLYAVIMKIP